MKWTIGGELDALHIYFKLSHLHAFAHSSTEFL